MKIEIKRMVLGPVQTNVYYVINPETKECVILDPADNAPRIRMAVNKLGVTPVAILLTHGHFDHIDAADEVRKMCDFGITIDERVADGYYFAKSIKVMEYILLHPEMLMEGAATKIEVPELR